LAAQVVPIFAVTSDVRGTWDTLVATLGFGAVVDLASDSSNFLAAVRSGLNSIFQEVIMVVEQDSM
jgi:hypothetical protein